MARPTPTRTQTKKKKTRYHKHERTTTASMGNWNRYSKMVGKDWDRISLARLSVHGSSYQLPKSYQQKQSEPNTTNKMPHGIRRVKIKISVHGQTYFHTRNNTKRYKHSSANVQSLV